MLETEPSRAIREGKQLTQTQRSNMTLSEILNRLTSLAHEITSDENEVCAGSIMHDALINAIDLLQTFPKSAAARDEITERFYIVVGAGRWAKGLTPADAKATLRRFGYKLADGYDLYRLPANAHNVSVDDMGAVCWSGGMGELEHLGFTPARKRKDSQ